MAGKQVDAEARDNLQPWLSSLRTPGLSREGMLKIYSDWTEKATYDTVRCLHLCFKLIITIIKHSKYPERSQLDAFFRFIRFTN